MTIPARRPIARGQLLIDGAWRDAQSGATMPTTDPTTESVITEVADASAADLDAAARAASGAFEDGPWPRLHHEARAKLLFRMADLLDERAEDFALREAMDMGMPYRDFRETIMPHCSGLFRFFGALAMHAMNGGYRTSYEPAIRMLTRREPLGVVGCITPFTALALAQVALDAGLPPGVYNLVTGHGSTVGEALVAHPLVDKIAFTGSTGVGQAIIRNAAATLKHTTMELGGKSPNIIFADADLDIAVQVAFWAIFWNKGEVCVAGSRLLVERPIYDAVVERLAKLANDAVLGDPLEANTMIGPIASRREFDKVMRYVEEGKRTARLVAGGDSTTVNGRGLFVRPTVFADATNDIAIGREEIFGPVLPVIPFDTEDEAVRIANDTTYGLASGIQTGDLRRALRLADRIRAGTVWLNTWHKYHPNAPFGGYKMSGYGREQGAEALESYTQYKTIWANIG